MNVRPLQISLAFVLLIFGMAARGDGDHDHPRSGKWPAVERAHLQKQPECQVCGTRKELNVHHIKAFHAYPELELDPDNLITLCHRDHFIFGHACDYRAWNPNVVADAKHAKRMIEQRRYGQ